MIIRKALAVVFIWVPLTGCMSSGPSYPVITERTLHEQEQYFGSFYPGQSIEEITKLIGPIAENYFEILEDGMSHQYLQARYIQTDELFALYLENGKLTGLILGQDVTNFHICRSSVTTNMAHWLSSGFSPYRAWIMDRNMLGNTTPAAVRLSKTSEESGFDPGVVAEAISWAPLIMVGLGLYAIDQVAGGMQQDAKRKSERQYLIEAAGSIQIGFSEEKLIYLMGQYDRRDSAGVATAYTYFVPSYSFGVKDGKVTWRESASMFACCMPPRNKYSVTGPSDCGSLKEIHSE